MYQLVYLSRPTNSLSLDDVQDIVNTSSERNATKDVTGLLLFDGSRFIQSLEGPKEDVLNTMDKIRLDPRHKDITVMPGHCVLERQFGDWSMYGRILVNVRDAEAFYKEVLLIIARVTSPEIFAAFLGFASLSCAPFRDAPVLRIVKSPDPS